MNSEAKTIVYECRHVFTLVMGGWRKVMIISASCVFRVVEPYDSKQVPTKSEGINTKNEIETLYSIVYKERKDHSMRFIETIS